jgi:hypothetical protein
MRLLEDLVGNALWDENAEEFWRRSSGDDGSNRNWWSKWNFFNSWQDK